MTGDTAFLKSIKNRYTLRICLNDDWSLKKVLKTQQKYSNTIFDAQVASFFG